MSVYYESPVQQPCPFSLILFAAMLFVNFHQDNIIPDLTDTVPRNDIFAVCAPETEAEAPGTWNYKGCDTAGFTVEFHIYRAAKGAAGTDIDHFFLF